VCSGVQSSFDALNYNPHLSLHRITSQYLRSSCTTGFTWTDSPNIIHHTIMSVMENLRSYLWHSHGQECEKERNPYMLWTDHRLWNGIPYIRLLVESIKFGYFPNTSLKLQEEMGTWISMLDDIIILISKIYTT
jgi:hypothetical protein